MNTIDTRMAKAMAHPLRAEALRILNERVASPSDIAREVGFPVANVSYHVNTLHRLGCIEEVEHRHVRGAIEHLYRAVRRPLAELPDSESMPPNVRNSIAATIFENSTRDAHAALSAGTVERRADVHFAFLPMELDEEGWSNVYTRLAEVFKDLEAEKAAAKARIDQGADAVKARVSVQFYESSSDDAS